MAEVYILDANAFIQAKRQFYRFSICPGYWKSLKWHCGQETLICIDRVWDEIEAGRDDLSDWMQREYGEGQIWTTDGEDVLRSYAEIIAWAQAQPQFSAAAKEEFARVEEADAWVAAFAKSRGAAVVTMENFSPDVKKRVLLPNVCEAFDIEWINPFEMLERLGVEMDWEEPE